MLSISESGEGLEGGGGAVTRASTAWGSPVLYKGPGPNGKARLTVHMHRSPSVAAGSGAVDSPDGKHWETSACCCRRALCRAHWGGCVELGCADLVLVVTP